MGALLEAMSDRILSGFEPGWALEEVRRTGIPGDLRGLDEVLERLRARRQKMAEALNLSGPLEGLRQRLQAVLELERTELARRADDDAGMRQALLDALPPHPAGALRELEGYDFLSPAAAAGFAELVEQLRRDVLNAYFGNLAGGLRDLGSGNLGRLKDMLADLNAMIAARARGEPYDFESFKDRYRDYFPENPKSLDELLEVLARRMAAMSRLVAGLSPQQRQELAELASSVLDDVDLAFQIDQLVSALRELAPGEPWDESAPALGQDAMPLTTAVDAIERVSELDELEATLSGGYPGATLDDVDDDKLRRALGDDAVRDLRRLKEIENALEDAGLFNRSKGRLELTARGARLMGERSLTRVLAKIKREPTHRAAGGEAEPTGQTRPFTFGDADPISVQRTIHNAVLRRAARAGGRSTGAAVRLSAEDLEIAETESRPRTATALLLDLSFSMPLRGHWIPAKRMALALDALIESKYPEDSLYLIGFSDYARRIKPAELASAGWEEVHGTNMQHAFLLARRLLVQDPSPIKQVIMVTDGEPTAHLLADGRALFHWPPARETIEKTLREAARVARSGIKINVFMLEEANGLVRFMERLARLTGGEVHPARSRDVGARVIGSYVGGATGRQR
jgi:uncharacterized protein with von Willebrand factor type A (vWA) domain